MKELILLYWGCVFLMYLSQMYYPSETLPHSSRTRSFMWHRADIFMVIVIAWLTCFSFLRTDYNDTGTYIHSFEHVETVKESIENGILTDFTGNPLSMLYRSIMREITSNYHIYFFFPAFLSSFAAIKLFSHYSVNPAFSLLIFFSVGTYIMYMAALKQCLAIFFLLLALPYAIDKKYVRFYLLVFVAILFHTHAFMFAIVPFLLGKPWNKVTFAGLAAVIFIMLTYDQTMGAFMELAQSIGAMVKEDELFDGHQINVIRVIVYWVPAILMLAFRDNLFHDSTRSENLFANMSIVSAFILSLGLVEGANLYARMAGYFEIASAVCLPWIIKKLFTEQSARYLTIIASVLYFGYFLFEFAITKSFGSEYSAISLWQFIKELFY